MNGLLNIISFLVLATGLQSFTVEKQSWATAAIDELAIMTDDSPEISNSDLMFALHASLSAQFPDLVFLVHVADNSSSLAALWSTTYEDNKITANAIWWYVGSKSMFVYTATAPACGLGSSLNTGAAWVLTGAAAAAADWTVSSSNSSNRLELNAAYTLENGPQVDLNLDLVLVTDGPLVVHSFNYRCLYQRSLPQMSGGWVMTTIIGQEEQPECSQ